MKTITDLRAMKGKEKISMITCYDVAFAQLMDGVVDIILVGDSVGMVVYGYENTLRVTVGDMIKHTAAVAKGAPTTYLCADMPAGSYALPTQAVANATLLLNAGARSVKVEGCRVGIVRALVRAGIPVMGHLGLTPQTILSFKVQGKNDKDAARLLCEATALVGAGCFSLVLECIPAQLAATITSAVDVPTIGIGAGKHCDGQVLVMHDLLNLYGKQFTFVRTFADLGTMARGAFTRYSSAVKGGKFPGEEHAFR